MAMGTVTGRDRLQAIQGALPWLVWSFLFLFAWRFADERLYSDSGYYLARVINEGSFHIEHGRWVLALAELFPLLGAKLGLGLRTLVLLHSLNNVLWLGACLLFASRVLRSPNTVLALVAVHLIGLTHGLFCPIFELYYGVDLLILFHATSRSDQLGPAWRWILLTLFLVGALSSHFFAVLLAAFLLAADRIWLERKLLLTLLAVAVVLLALRLSTLSVYEQSGLEFLAKLREPREVLALFAPARIGELTVYLAIHYLDMALITIALVVAFWRSRERRALVVLLGGLLVLYLLSGLFLPGFTHDRYREQVNFATTAFVLILLCTRLLPMPRWRTISVALLACACLFRIVRAEWIAPWYTERTALIKMETTVARDGGVSKAIVAAPIYFGPPHHLIDLSWSTSVESLLLSAQEAPSSTVSLITTQDLELPEVRAQLDRFIFRRWDILDPSWLDKRYFEAPVGRYVLLPADPSVE